MKKMLLLIAVLFSISASYARFYPSGTYELVRNYLKEKNYTIVEDRFKDLKEGSTTYLTRTFYKGLTYIIYGFTEDTDVNDLDLYLYDADDDTEIKKDVESDATPVIIFTPYYTREVKIILKNADSDTPDFASRCRFMVGYKE